MFLVTDQRYGAMYRVFTVEDPRKNGFNADLIEGVRLDYDLETVHRWPRPTSSPIAPFGKFGTCRRGLRQRRFGCSKSTTGWREAKPAWKRSTLG